MVPSPHNALYRQYNYLNFQSFIQIKETVNILHRFHFSGLSNAKKKTKIDAVVNAAVILSGIC